MKIFNLILFILLLVGFTESVYGEKKKVGQTGMTYLAISMCARESAMGDAATASVKGVNGFWHNPAVLADIERFAVSFNQVNWLVNTKLSGLALAYTSGNWGTFGIDLTYMDYGEIIGTRPVAKSINPRGFELTEKIGVEDYAFGFSYARRINERFSFGFKIKRLHESLGSASLVVDEYDDPETGDITRIRETRIWELNDWGLDFGTIYHVGWKNLTIAMTMQNFSRDMKYWFEEFQLPLTIRMGLAVDVTEFFLPNNENMDFNLSMDGIHPIDYLETVNLGAEFVFQKKIALRSGYKFNHDVESFSAGVGAQFEFSGVSVTFDYAYTMADYFQDINRFSAYFTF
jgi:hypothetical protein